MAFVIFPASPVIRALKLVLIISVTLLLVFIKMKINYHVINPLHLKVPVVSRDISIDSNSVGNYNRHQELPRKNLFLKPKRMPTFLIQWNDSGIAMSSSKEGYLDLFSASKKEILTSSFSADAVGPAFFTIWADYQIQVQVELPFLLAIGSRTFLNVGSVSSIRIRANTFALDLGRDASMEIEPRLGFLGSEVTLSAKKAILDLGTGITFTFTFQGDSWSMSLFVGNYLHPLGLFGKFLRQSAKKELDWRSAYIERDPKLPSYLYHMNMFCEEEKEQVDLENYDYNGKSASNFIIEGPLFDNQGFTNVNRYMWWHLIQSLKSTSFRVILQPTDRPKVNRKSGLLVHEIFRYYMRQRSSMSNLESHRNVLFRNSWPPNFDIPSYLANSSSKLLYFHQQPWEFTAIPKAWIPKLVSNPTQIWVPSKYSALAFRPFLPELRISIIPHGVSVFKHLALANRRLSFPALQKYKDLGYFIFLFSGGLLPRKGIDVLFQGYKLAFKRGEKVLLVIHSVYGDGFWESDLQRHQNLNCTPAVMFIKDAMGEAEKIQLYSSADAYVSPFRSEGFGLTIIEAICHNLPIIISRYGPTLEFPYPHFYRKARVYFVNGTETKCRIKPCGPNAKTIFDEPVDDFRHTLWFEPSIESLQHQLVNVYNDGDSVYLSKQPSFYNTLLEDTFGWRKPIEAILSKLN